MRVLAIGLLALAFAASPAIARTAGTGDDKDAAVAAKKVDASKPATDKSAPSASKTEAPAKPAPASLDNQLQELRGLLEAQSKQLQEQNDALKEQRKEMEVMRENLKAVNAPLENEGAIAASARAADPTGNAVNYFAATPDNPDAAEIRYKGITLKPGGFLAAEGVWRQGAESATVNSDFKAIPMPGASQAKLSDLEFTGRQSQINLLAEGKVDTMRLRGYVETDFLSAGVTSNNNESNSYTLRMRQAWGQAQMTSGWEFTGGQMWSLVTETGTGTEPLTEVRPLTIDAQYNVGFSWARQFGFRVSKSFDDNKLTFAVSVEDGETTFVGHGFAITNTTTTPGGATGAAVLLTTATSIGNTLVGNIGDLGGLENNQANYSYNSSPDFVLKAALDPGWGHYEIFGVVGTAKTRIFPCATASVALPCIDGTMSPSAFGATNDIRTIGGIGLNARAPLFNKKLDVGFHFLGGSGVGRYGTSGIQDVTARPDGTLAAIKSYQALVSLVVHPTPRLDVYAYVGGEYGGRTAYTNAAGGPVGYGSKLVNNSGCRTETLPNSGNSALTSVNLSGGESTPTKTGLSPTAYNGFLPGALANCTADTRNLIEGTLGFWYRFYNGPKGRLQSGLQYSYTVRNTWSGLPNDAGIGGPAGRQNMVLTSFRYYLP
jgi:uncharacterized coiled-coil protein SlyX